MVRLLENLLFSITFIYYAGEGEGQGGRGGDRDLFLDTVASL